MTIHVTFNEMMMTIHVTFNEMMMTIHVTFNEMMMSALFCTRPTHVNKITCVVVIVYTGSW